jgi:Fur family ferric uptake transcriptional regulator
MRSSEQRRFRMTRQRRFILEEIEKTDSHPTADEMHRMVRRRLPHISLSTVYRNLTILSRGGMIRKLELGGNQSRYDATKNDHYHVHCISCGRVDDVPIEKSIDIRNAFRYAGDYEILGHRLEVFGLCPRCKSRNRAPSRKHRRSPQMKHGRRLRRGRNCSRNRD